ncbi:hypothetical protein L6164_012919 [Bauhinia variegata]|uniref:Uncharacterized protein n=1 Tax=Bauhinia variegata TaxID=167791 RepID=A0ACB9PCS8_BAUVA|nr:hypothetical protein L6164_012919 [Bauhinia variegata]
MANNLWNLRQGNLDASNHVHHPHYNNSPIACRLCNQIFLSNQALLSHIESHIAHEENNLKTLTNPPRQNISGGGARCVLPPAQLTQPPLLNYSSSMNNVTATRVDFPGSQLLMTEGSSMDGTKQYIKQLEKPIKSIEIIDLVDEENDLQAVDLNLTL